MTRVFIYLKPTKACLMIQRLLGRRSLIQNLWDNGKLLFGNAIFMVGND